MNKKRNGSGPLYQEIKLDVLLLVNQVSLEAINLVALLPSGVKSLFADSNLTVLDFVVSVL